MLFLSRASLCQTISQTYIITGATDSVLVLPDSLLIENSIELRLDSTILLHPGTDYSINNSSRLARVTLSKSIRDLLYANSLSGTSSNKPHTILFSAQVYPSLLKRHYTFFNAPPLHDSSEKIIPQGRPLSSSHDQSTSGLTFVKNGGISRGLQVGSSQDATFTNAFNLTFSGSLSNDLTFKGALSEESTPLQPEGNTQTLRDIDRIFIEVRSRDHAAAIIGDHPLSLSHIRLDSIDLDTKYDNINRKVLGATATVQIQPTAMLASYSVTKGQFISNSLESIDGVQGPYRLTGKNGDPAIIVIAGTEKVYIDGVLQVRGEQNDYVIDYGLAEIRFTAKHIITASSRITVDFEYTNEQYSRDLFAAKQSSSFFNNALQLTTSYLREGDDQDNPKELTLTDSDKAILKAAGNDASRAFKSGVTIAGRDSSGKARGNYIAIDTIIAGKPIHFYRYAPFDSINALYTIAFGFVGTAKGNYSRKNIREYEYTGPGNGDFDTLVYLPLPTLHEAVSGKVAITPFNGLNASAEGAISSVDPNRFATDPSSKGSAYTLSIGYIDTLLRSDSLDRMTVGISGTSIYTAAAFLPFDRIRLVESMRSYGIENATVGTESLGHDERENNIRTQVQLFGATAGFQAGDYTLGNNYFSSRNYQYSLGYVPKNLLYPQVESRYSLIHTEDSLSNEEALWNIFSVVSHNTIPISNIVITPSVGFSYTEKKNSIVNSLSDSLTAESFRLQEFTPSIQCSLDRSASFGLSYHLLYDDSSRFGLLKRIATTNDLLFNSTLSTSQFNGKFDIGYHSRSFIDSQSSRMAGGDNTSLLLHLAPRFSTLDRALSIDADYQTTEQRTAAQERLFFPVLPGQGNYTYLGDLNGNGRQDPEEFQLARYSDQGTYILLTIPSTILTPTVDLRTSVRLRLAPEQLPENNFLHLLSPLSSESYIHIEENSSDPHTSTIYFFRNPQFLDDTTTLRGIKEYQQDLYFFEHSSDLSFRLRWHERSASTQYTTGTDRIYHRDVSLFGKFKLSSEFFNESTLSYDQDNVRSNQFSTNRPEESKKYKIITTTSYEPFPSPLRLESVLSYAVLDDPLYFSSSRGSISSATLRCRYRLTTQLALTSEATRNELIAPVSIETILPYPLTDGLPPGITWGWSIGADQELTRGVVINLRYEGRSEPGIDVSERHITHVGRAEIKASF